MKTLFFLKAKCLNTNNVFYIRHDFAADDKWVITYGVKELPSSTTEEGEGVQINYAGTRTGPQYKCPHCGNVNFVRCGKCQEITCHIGGGNKDFKCAHCGTEGKIGGHIESVKTQNTGSGQ